MNLPNGIVNNIIDCALDEEKCKICRRWKSYQTMIENHLEIKRSLDINVEDDIIIGLTVYERPPYSYIRAFLKISKKKYDMINSVLWMLLYHRRPGFDLREDIKTYIERKKFNVKNTVRDINIFFKMMFERSKMYQALNSHQLTYYPELKL